MAGLKIKNPEYVPGNGKPEYVELKPIISKQKLIETIGPDFNEVFISPDGNKPQDPNVDIWLDMTDTGGGYSVNIPDNPSIDNSEVVQELGDSRINVMSQRATTLEFNKAKDRITVLERVVLNLQKQIDDIIAGGGGGGTKITDALLLNNGQNYLILNDGSYLKIKL